MKILLYTDNHFCEKSSIIRSRGKHFTTRLENQIQTLNWLNKLAVDEKCDKMVCLGDFFELPNITAEELSALREIEWNNLPKEFIVGNHELGETGIEFNSANALSKYGEIIDKPTIKCGYGYEILYLPYISESNRKPLLEIIEDISKKTYQGTFTAQEVKERIILSHNDLKGIRYGQYESKQGFDIKEIEQNCSLFINGHLHNQQQVTDKILNLGNLTGLNFGEDGFKYSHCAGILDTDTLKIRLVNNPYAFYFYQINSFKALVSHENIFSDNYSIATIKVAQNELNKAREICDKHFKAYRLLVDRTNQESSSEDISKLLKTDYYSEFTKCCLDNMGDNEILKEELSLLATE